MAPDPPRIRKPWHIMLIEWLITVPSDESSPTRNYQIWNSERQLFILGGRFRTLRQTPIVIGTFIACVIPLVLFCIFDASWCWSHVSPAVVIMFLYCWLNCMSSMVRASTKDPGYLPKNIHITDDPHDLPPEYFNVISLPCNDKSVDVRYCHTCRIWRMPRSFHCSKCDQCISLHDHHCIWLNNCIGERNYRYFFGFLLFAVICTIYIPVLGYIHIFQYQRDHDMAIGTALRHTPMTLFNIIYCHIAMLYPLLLLVFHVSLISTQQTTREYLKNWKINKPNPYNQQNFIKNIVTSLCGPRGESFISARAHYEPGDMRFERL